MTKEYILNFLKEHKDELHQKYSITKIGLFGSYATGNATDESDVDISIETDMVDPFRLVHLKEELSAAFKKPIDIIRFRESMNPYIKEHIIKNAIYV